LAQARVLQEWERQALQARQGRPRLREGEPPLGQEAARAAGARARPQREEEPRWTAARALARALAREPHSKAW
jgi:hypothetical protein